jgi:hypothetical protein
MLSHGAPQIRTRIRPLPRPICGLFRAPIAPQKQNCLKRRAWDVGAGRKGAKRLGRVIKWTSSASPDRNGLARASVPTLCCGPAATATFAGRSDAGFLRRGPCAGHWSVLEGQAGSRRAAIGEAAPPYRVVAKACRPLGTPQRHGYANEVTRNKCGSAASSDAPHTGAPRKRFPLAAVPRRQGRAH